jgi:hypothetical protein
MGFVSPHRAKSPAQMNDLTSNMTNRLCLQCATTATIAIKTIVA